MEKENFEVEFEETKNENKNLVPVSMELSKINYESDSLVNDLSSLTALLDEENRLKIQQEINSLERIKEEMIRGLYFVTVQGSLKTGKSTLTNLLVGNKIAITQAGVDTTKTPYVITKSPDDEARIVVYELIKNPKNENEIKSVVESIIDDVKGIKLKSNPYSKFFRRREIDFNEKNIRKYTVEEAHSKALFINIQLPKPKGLKEWILDHDIAILDTPGIEGQKAQKSQTVIDEIKKRTNMLIAMQSTVTPINKEEVNTLKEYENEGVEMRLMYNQFELKPWANEYDRKKFLEEEEKALQKGKEILRSEFELEDVVDYKVNLAKVDDYLRDKKSYESLKPEYDSFMEWVESLIISINEIKVEEKKRKAKKQFLNRLKEWQREDGVLLKIKESLQKELESIEKRLKDIKSKFEEYEDVVRAFREVFFNKRNSDINEYINVKLSKETNTHLVVSNNLINKNKENLIKEIVKFSKNLVKEMNELLKVYVLRALENEKKISLDPQFNELKEFLKSKSYTQYANRLPEVRFSLNTIPDILSLTEVALDEKKATDIVEDNKFIEKRGGIDLFGKKKIMQDKYLLVGEVENYLKDYYARLARERVREFIEDLQTDIYNGSNGVLDEHLKSVEKVYNDLAFDYERVVKDKKEKAKKAVSLIEEIVRKSEFIQKEVSRS